MIYFSRVFDNVFSSWHIFFVHKNNISSSYPTGVYLFKVNKENIKAMREVYLMLTIQIPERRQHVVRVSHMALPKILGKWLFKKVGKNVINVAFQKQLMYLRVLWGPEGL